MSRALFSQLLAKDRAKSSLLQSAYHLQAQMYAIRAIGPALARARVLQGALFCLTKALGSDLAGGNS